MPREADLFEAAHGDPLEGYLLLKNSGGNIPPQWIERARLSRQRRHKQVAQILKNGDWGDIAQLREWSESFRKECFYYGIRVLFELERKGKTDM